MVEGRSSEVLAREFQRDREEEEGQMHLLSGTH
jgi:hypothetical protein